MKWSFRIGSIMGIPVMVHMTFVLLLILIFFAGAPIVGIGGLNGVLFVVLIFASVVFHELSHSIVARHFGIEVVDITLLPIGGVARMPNPPKDPIQEILISVAGPAASLILAFCLWILADLFGTEVTLSDLSVRGNMLAQLSAVNFILAVFNLIPAFPMDGGRVLRGLLGLYLSPYTSTRVAVGVGQVFAILLFFLGLWVMNLFMILIAMFVYLGAEAEERQMGIMMSLGGVTAGSAMSTNVETVSPSSTLGEVATLYAKAFQADFPVVDDRRLVGLVTRDALVTALHQSGPSALVSQAMVRDFFTAVEDTPLTEVLKKMQDSGINAVPILKGSELRGLITLEQIGKFNMLCSGYSCDFIQAEK